MGAGLSGGVWDISVWRHDPPTVERGWARLSFLLPKSGLPMPSPRAAQVGSGGLVRDPAVHRQVIERVVGAYEAAGFACQGWRESPIKGAAAGNTEFISYFKRRQQEGVAAAEVAAAEPGAAAAADAG